MKLRHFVLTLIAALLLSAVATAQTNSPKEKEKQATAIAVADHWLQLVDANNVRQSWEEAAEPFQQAVNPIKWADLLKRVRTPLGKVISRSLRSAEYKTQLPGVPDGEYFLIQYNTSFENKKSAVKTVTPMLGKDGKWKVSGYFIE